MEIAWMLFRDFLIKSRPYVAGIFLYLFSLGVFANPVLQNISAGNVSIQQTTNQTIINQTSQKSILNWQSFNIGAGETTHFQQPVGGVSLNRINSSSGVSQIYGRLTATGQIILVNPAGIFFGPNSYVNVGGLIVSTARISDKDFLNAYYHFTKSGFGAIVNEGTIIAADHGLVALIGGAVSNTGMIEAKLGSIAIGAGNAFTISLAGNDLINFTVDSGVNKLAVDQNGKQMHDGVSNTGKIIANGGQVLISAKDAAGVLDHVINLGGLVSAKSVYKHNGEIVISGGSNAGVVRIAGKFNASGKHHGNSGGNVTITGYNILLDSTANIDVSGDVGGGNVYVGGSAKGQGPLSNANAVFMAPGAVINANALTNGNGGHVVLWSNNYTNASGAITAEGGSQSGNGGFIETSSHDILDVGNLLVNTNAANGATGTWLLDPIDVTITSSATANGSFNAGTPNIFTPSAETANILNSTINTDLASTGVTILTTGTGGSGNITVSAPISWSSGNALILNANGAIAINSTIATGTSASSLSMIAANASSQTAVISGGGQLIWQGPGTMTLSQANTYTGGTSVAGGTLAVTAANGLGTSGAISVTSGATLSVALGGGTLGNAGALTLNGAGVNGVGALEEAGTTGTDIMSNAITLGSATTIGATSGPTLSLSGGITNSTFLLTLNGAGNITESGIIGASSGGLTMAGTGTLSLTGVNTYTGATIVDSGIVDFNGAGKAASSASFTVNQGGTLLLDNLATNVTNRLGGKALTLNGGELQFKGSSVNSTNAAETMGILTLGSNQSTITVFKSTAGTPGTTKLTFSSLVDTASATVLFRGIGQSNNLAASGTTANINFTTAPTTGNGLLIGGGALNSSSAPIMQFAFGDLSTSGTGTDLVTYDNGTNTTGMRLLVRAN